MQCDHGTLTERCGNEHVFEVRLPRPSDPSDMCCIVVLCGEHGSYVEGSQMTAAQWAEWIGSDVARQRGALFLT